MERQTMKTNKGLIVIGVIAAMLLLTAAMWALMGCESTTVAANTAEQEISATTADAQAGQEAKKAEETSDKATANAQKGTAEAADKTSDSTSKSATSDKADKTADKTSKESKSTNKSTDKNAKSDSSKKTPSAKASASGWNMDIDCAGCHVKEADLASDEKCTQGVAHENVDLTCITCHTDEEVLTEVHADVTADDKMPKKATVETVDPETCEGCHGTMEEMAEKTADSTALKDDKGTVVNPHEIPEVERHEENPATCTDCHNNHSTNLSKDAMKYCAQCHHRGRFECGTCHEIREAAAAK